MFCLPGYIFKFNNGSFFRSVSNCKIWKINQKLSSTSDRYIDGSGPEWGGCWSRWAGDHFIRMHYIVKYVGWTSMWPLWTGSGYIQVTANAVYTVILPKCIPYLCNLVYAMLKLKKIYKVAVGIGQISTTIKTFVLLDVNSLCPYKQMNIA